MLAMVLVFGMAVVGCGQKGGTVTFTNDLSGGLPGLPPGIGYPPGFSAPTVTVGIAVSTSGTPNAPVVQTVNYGNEISASIDEDGYYAVSGSIVSSGSTTPKTISKSGRLTGGETITIKASEF
jgi:hypothetical protein